MPAIVISSIFTRLCHLLCVQVVKEVHDILSASIEVSLVVLVGYVPAQRPKLASLLHSGVEEGYCVVHGLPLGQVGVVQSVLGRVGVCPLQTSLDSLGRLKSVLDGGLQKVDGVLGVHLGGQPQTECFVHLLCLQHTLQQLIQEV